MANLGPDFYKKLVEISNELSMKPEDILNVMAVESGLNPAAHNKNGNASGLIQFMPATLKNIGFKGSNSDFRDLRAEQQLDYVKRLISANIKYNGGPFKSAAQYYISNFVPAALKIPGVQNEDPSTIIVSKEPTVAHIPHVSIKTESIYYNANKGLDYDNDGNITFGDIQKILARAAGGKNFKQAIADMKNYTSYQPSINQEKSLTPENDKEDLFGKYLNKFKMNEDDVYSKLNKSNKPIVTAPSNTNALDNIMDSYLQMVAASEKYNKKLYKKFLPNNHITIQIKTADYINAIEFARILCATLDEELLSKSYTYTNDQSVEVGCSIPGPYNECLEAVNQISESVSEAFKLATNKIGKVIVKTACNMNKKPSYKQINIQAADSNYRKFLLKFI